MKIETLNQANEIYERIQDLHYAKKQVQDQTFVKKQHPIPLDVMEAGKGAMLAVIDEAIDAALSELKSL